MSLKADFKKTLRFLLREHESNDETAATQLANICRQMGEAGLCGYTEELRSLYVQVNREYEKSSPDKKEISRLEKQADEVMGKIEKLAEDKGLA